VALALVVLATGGCAPFLGGLMVSSPNRFNPLAATQTTLPPVARRVLGLDQQFRVEVGPPEASLAVSVIEPRERDVPKGTILVLHGVWDESLWLVGTAKALAKAGYRAVLVDLRGHGRSSGDWLGYGVQEAEDLSQVIDVLEDRNLVDGPLGVWGISYGATTSIHLAGHDPRIRSVVAVAPFSTMRDVVPDYSRTILPGVGSLIPDATLQEAVTAGGKRADFDPDLADAVSAIQKTDAPVLILHGTEDWMVPPYHSMRLHAAARDHSQLVMLPWTGHISIWFDPTHEVQSQTRQWFDRWLAGGADASVAEK
jgi:pimeloyl-ACP methyl ester carboxylesterase